MDREGMTYLVLAVSAALIIAPVVYLFSGIDAAIWSALGVLLIGGFLHCFAVERDIMADAEREE